jgi:hypothetical protein
MSACFVKNCDCRARSVNSKLLQGTGNLQKEIYISPGTKQEAHNEKARDNAWS